jgi:esterase/lipase superfamily enzyme
MATTTVYFATNRAVSGPDTAPQFGTGFNAVAPWYLRFGSAEVTTPSDVIGGKYRFKSAQLAPDNVGAAPAKAGAAAPPLGSRVIFETLREQMKSQQCDLLILIHGFATKFEEAMERAAQLKLAYAQPGVPQHVFVFSWPADGEMIPQVSYYRDRDDAKASAEAMARAFLKLIDYFKAIGPKAFCWRSLHLVAHSMGNYALRHALQAIITKFPGRTLPRVFTNIFLMAADEDADTFEFEHKLARLPELAEQVLVTYSPGDKALHISDSTKGNPDRLGAMGPRVLTNLPLKVTLLDVQDVDGTGAGDVNHQYYRKRKEVVADVKQVIAGLSADRIKGRVYIPEKRAYRIKRGRS